MSGICILLKYLIHDMIFVSHFTNYYYNETAVYIHGYILICKQISVQIQFFVSNNFFNKTKHYYAFEFEFNDID